MSNSLTPLHIETKRPSTLLAQSANKQSPTSMPAQTPTSTQQPSLFRLPPQPNHKVQQLLNLFRSPQTQSRSYRQTIEQIVSSFTMMDNLTNKLEQKVDMMLNNQKLEFIESYKRHMKRVKQEFEEIDKKVAQYEQKILYYENEGEMSHLVIKVNKLQLQCKNLYKSLAEKEKLIRDHQLTMKVQKSEIKRYQKQLKLLMRQKNLLQSKLQNNTNGNTHGEENKQQQSQLVKDAIFKSIGNGGNSSKSPNQSSSHIRSINSANQLIFPTELQPNYKQPSHPQINNASSKSKKPYWINQSSQQSLTLDVSLDHRQSNVHLTNIVSPSQQSMLDQHNKARELQLRREISHLKKKNRILTSYQSHVLSANTSMESFFINCINQIKQQIKIKKKINRELTLQEFKKQDKIQLLIKVLSNDDILVHLYERLFKKNQTMRSELNNQDHSNDANIRQGLRSLYELGGQRDIVDGKIQQLQNKQRLIGLIKEKQLQAKQRKQKALSHANKRVSKHISQNSLLPKIHFHLEY